MSTGVEFFVLFAESLAVVSNRTCPGFLVATSKFTTTFALAGTVTFSVLEKFKIPRPAKFTETFFSKF